jgi:hypothetical protein
MKIRTILAATALCSLSTLPVAAQAADMEDTSMSFFITSIGSGQGANLGGLQGADAHCAALASAAGSNGKTWRAYLSTSGANTVHARERIGQGPWYNADGELVARNLDDLHYSNVLFTKQTALNEMGNIVNGRGDNPNQHDILTGSNPDGSSSGSNCNNWTSSAEDGSATVGHFDRQGGGAIPESWNAAHQSRGCSLENLRGSGGNGYFYCFAQ